MCLIPKNSNFILKPKKIIYIKFVFIIKSLFNLINYYYIKLNNIYNS